MTRSVYIIGGAGAGKSTFTAELLGALGCVMGPMRDIYAVPNARGSLVTLRGHGLVGEPGEGLYIGCMREEFPGTDGLDRASSITGEAWLEDPGLHLPGFIISEGSTLSTRRFLGALHSHTDLLLVHLHCEEFVRELRFLQRGSNQSESFVKITVTRSANLLADMAKAGVRTVSIDTADPDQWEFAKDLARAHAGAGYLAESAPAPSVVTT